jgi:hypothetical protein
MLATRERVLIHTPQFMLRIIKTIFRPSSAPTPSNYSNTQWIYKQKWARCRWCKLKSQLNWDCNGIESRSYTLRLFMLTVRFRFDYHYRYTCDWLIGKIKRIWLVNGSGSGISISVRSSRRGFKHRTFNNNYWMMFLWYPELSMSR